MTQNGEIAIEIDEWWDPLLDNTVTLQESLCYIHRVPGKLRVDGEKKYDPQVISIGPYHRHPEKALEITDNHKKLYLQSFISRSKAPGSMKGDVRGKLIEVLDAARKCYAESINLDDKQFARMLALDGCFILELLYKYVEFVYLEENEWQENSTSSNQRKKALAEDILFSKSWIISSIRRDLVLLENQIPFCVLECLFQLTYSPQTKLHRAISLERTGSFTKYPSQTNSFTKLVTMVRTSFSRSKSNTQTQLTIPKPMSLNELIASFFDPILPTVSDDKIDPTIRGEHLLDLLRSYLLGSSQISKVQVGTNQYWEHTTCATDLQEAGVNFKKKDTSKGLLDITFSDGTFEIPPFYFGESWTVLFPNIIALEQCRHNYQDEITSYAILMDNLIDSSNDVKLLREKDIIDGTYKEDENIAQAVNNLCKKAIGGKFCYDGLCSDVNAYRKTIVPTWRAAFMRKVIHTPWAGVSVLAAVILLLLTVTQTVFSVLSWVKPPK